MEKQKVLFYDKKGNINLADISKIDSDMKIIAYNDASDKIGSLECYLTDGRIFISNIECLKKERGKGIGTALLDILDYALKDKEGIVYGIYSPHNEIDEEKTRLFYQSNGYAVVSKEEFESNRLNYTGLEEDDFNEANKKYGYSIVYKNNVKKDKYRFIEIEDFLIEQDGWGKNEKSLLHR